jgi:hypothetical protein
MKQRYALAVLAVGAFADVAPAEADTKQLAKAQSWEAFGGTTSGGRGVCGISASPADRYFSVKVFAGNDRITIQMGTPEWKQLPPDQKVAVTMRFDANAEWNAPATSFRFEDGDMGLQVFVNRAEMNTFSSEFRSSSKLALRFDDRRLAPWILGLEGTAVVNGAFQNCVRTLK